MTGRSLALLALACVLAGWGCRAPAPATPRDAEPINLGFAEIELYSAEQLGFRLHADGTITNADGARLGRITRDGKIVSRTGETLAMLTADGFVVDGEGKRTNARVLPDGTLEIHGRRHRFEEDGTLSGGKPGAPTIRAAGLTRASRRAAMFLLVAILMPKAAPALR
jgi:hypothetical protein